MASIQDDLQALPVDGSSTFHFTAKPRQQLLAGLRISNESSTPQSLVLYPSDAITTASGGLAPLPEHALSYQVGRWIALDQTHVVIAPHSQVEVGFSLTPPSNAAVGEHLGAIVLQRTSAPSRTAGVSVVKRLGLRVYVTIPGAAHPRLSVHPQLQLGRQVRLVLQLRNSGNTILTPRGQITLRQQAGWALQHHAVAAITLLPQQQAQIVWHVPSRHHLIARYHLTTRLQYGPSDQFSYIQVQSFWWVWWPGVFILLGIVLGIPVAWWVWRRTRRNR